MDANAALIDTPIGAVGLAWRGRRLLRVALPEDAPGTTLARLCERAGAAGVAAPPWVRALGKRIARHLEGEHDDLADVPLADDDVPAFQRRVYAALRTVPIGRTVSYLELAARAGSPGAARAVGTAMRSNPWPIVVPCHRVLAAQGRPGGFSAPGGLATKERLLAAEGVSLGPPRSLFARDGELDAAVSARLAAMRAADPALCRLMDRIGPPTLTRTAMASPFDALARAIVYQQLSGKAAATILGRVEALFPRRRLTPEGLAAMDDASLRAAGLSRGKTAAMRDLARHTLEGTVPARAVLERLSDEEIIERLTVVRGIGRWTVQMLLMFRLGRPDVLPVDDFGVRKGFSLAFGTAMPTPKELAEHGKRWRPNRTLASWYLWRATDTP